MQIYGFIRIAAGHGFHESSRDPVEFTHSLDLLNQERSALLRVRVSDQVLFGLRTNQQSQENEDEGRKEQQFCCVVGPNLV